MLKLLEIFRLWRFVAGLLIMKRRLSIQLLVALWSLLASNVVQAQTAPVNVKLNPPLSQNSNILDVVAITPDGNTVIYKIDQDRTSALYKVPIRGGEATKLSGAMVAGGTVAYGNSQSLSADGKYLVYVADQEVENRRELYSVSLATGAIVKLNKVGSGQVESFRITPDGSFVVYTMIKLPFVGSDPVELYSVPISGGNSILLNNAANPDTKQAQVFMGSNDGKHIVYSATPSTPGSMRLFHVASAGGTVTMLNQPLASDGAVHYGAFRIVDNQRVLYLAQQAANAPFELYSVALDGSGRSKLNRSLVGDERLEGVLRLTSNNSHVVYMIKKGTDATFSANIYSVPLGGGDSKKLNIGLPEGKSVSQYEISPDNSRVVYTINQWQSFDYEFHSVRLDGTEPSQLAAVTQSGGPNTSYFVISPDSSTVIYTDHKQVHSIPIAGGTATLLDAFPFGTTIYMQFTSDGKHVIYSGAKESVRIDLFLTPFQGGAVIKLNGANDGEGSLEPYSWALSAVVNDSFCVAYIASDNSNSAWELYSSCLNQAPPGDKAVYLPVALR